MLFIGFMWLVYHPIKKPLLFVTESWISDNIVICALFSFSVKFSLGAKLSLICVTLIHRIVFAPVCDTCFSNFGWKVKGKFVSVTGRGGP
jgi:hypothetical protein